ncbi:ORF-41 [Teiidae poxvirus 1]|nr:ORF-41 [Teiidae poxvirus 1]
MKGTIILFGKPACQLCKLSIEILSNEKIANNYEVYKVNILSFLRDSKVVEILGMNKFYELVTAIGEKLGNEYVLLFKYDEETKQMAYVPLKKYLVVGQMSYSSIDFNQLLEEIDSSPYNVLLTDK